MVSSYQLTVELVSIKTIPFSPFGERCWDFQEMRQLMVDAVRDPKETETIWLMLFLCHEILMYIFQSTFIFYVISMEYF